jgi:hypothetical protein
MEGCGYRLKKSSLEKKILAATYTCPLCYQMQLRVRLYGIKILCTFIGEQCKEIKRVIHQYEDDRRGKSAKTVRAKAKKA